MDPSVFRFTGGYAAPAAAPGLGIEIDESAVARAAEIGHRWRNPVWRGPDGSFREW
jgi:galactonate dehydratase